MLTVTDQAELDAEAVAIGDILEELPQKTGPQTGEIDWNDMLDISDFDEDSDTETDEDSSENVIDGDSSEIDEIENTDNEEEIEIKLPETVELDTENVNEEDVTESEDTEEEKN